MPKSLLERPWGSTDDLKIKKLEKSIGVTFPKEYRDFLLNQNGGKPKQKLSYRFIILGKDGESVIHFYYGVDAANYGDLALIYKSLHTHQRRMPDSLFPIACDPFGNHICLILDKKRYGEVVHWEMGEMEPEFDEDTKKWSKDPLCNSFTIAKSFTEFMGTLKIEKID